MCFGEKNATVAVDNISSGDGQAPALFAIDERNVDQDGEVVGAVVIGDGVDEAEFFGDGVAGVGEDGERQAMLAGHEVALARDLRADGDHEGVALAEGAVEIAPGFELGDAIGAPAAAEELDDQRAEGEQVGGADEAAGGVFEGELGSDGADGEDFLLDAGGEELGDGAFANGEAVGLDQVAGVGGDLVELVLQGGGACWLCLTAGMIGCEVTLSPEALFAAHAHGADAAAHHVAGQAAFAHLLEHLGHLGVLAEEIVYVLDLGAAAVGDALAAGAGDDFVVAALFGGHGVDDGFEARELLFVDVLRGLLQAGEGADGGHHLEDAIPWSPAS